MKTVSFLVLTTLAAFAEPGQEPPKPAAQAPEKQEALEATVVAVKGTVDVKRPEDKDWVAAERNMKLKAGSSICTAVASTATLLFTGNVKIDVKPLTEAKLEELAKKGGAMNADLKLKFGSIEVDIQKGDLRSDMKVTAPNSTTSVSGSRGIVRAPATGGGCRVTLRTVTGTWTHSAAGVDRELSGPGVADNFGGQLRDLRAADDRHLYTEFFGRKEDEVYKGRFSGKAGDVMPWDVPFSDYTRGPAGPRILKQGVLPLPPGTPF